MNIGGGSSEPNYYTEESNFYNNFEDIGDQPNFLNPSPHISKTTTQHNLNSDASNYAYLQSNVN
jgi:hypothetical protein